MRPGENPRKGRRQIIGAALLLAGVALPAGADTAPPVPYPHDSARPEYCLDCHSKDIYRGDCDDPSGFCLLSGSVDGLCLRCHLPENCCRTGQEHQAKLYIGGLRHASDLEVGRVKIAYRPRTLPIHRGKITCRTCHLHTKVRADDYKMLRIVKRDGEQVDWSVLCKDCHEENF
jgi:nitrate/TMAO reductase-like tetraheme cytochrome c subunit